MTFGNIFAATSFGFLPVRFGKIFLPCASLPSAGTLRFALRSPLAFESSALGVAPQWFSNGLSVVLRYRLLIGSPSGWAAAIASASQARPHMSFALRTALQVLCNTVVLESLPLQPAATGLTIRLSRDRFVATALCCTVSHRRGHKTARLNSSVRPQEHA